MVNILHILPEDGTGGAEIAARSAAQQRDEVVVLFLRKGNHHPNQEVSRIQFGGGQSAFSPKAILKAVRLVDEIQPDVVVFSLWKSFAVFIVLNLLRPGRKFVLFLHSDRSVHALDHWLSKIMYPLSHAIWADSTASLQRLPHPEHYRTRIISFFLHRTKNIHPREVAPHFIYWGRLQELKNIPAAVDLFAMIAKDYPSATFTLIGPDAGMEKVLKQQVGSLGLDEQVRFMGFRSYEQIVELAQNASFFLQLSHQEGMAMSVVEAMQMGLVPIVTPVGEIANYCHDMENCILYEDAKSAAEKIGQLLGNPHSFAKLSTKAIESWQDKPLYYNDFSKAGCELCHDSAS